MNYGIKEEENFLLCANCENVISENGTIPFNYCPNCSNPLTLDAITQTEQNKISFEKNVLDSLMEIAKQNKTNALTDVLKVYFKK